MLLRKEIENLRIEKDKNLLIQIIKDNPKMIKNELIKLVRKRKNEFSFGQPTIINKFLPLLILDGVVVEERVGKYKRGNVKQYSIKSDENSVF